MEAGFEDKVIGAVSLVKTPKNGKNDKVNIWLRKMDSRGLRPTQRNMRPGDAGHRYSLQRYESHAGQLPIAVAGRLGSNSQEEGYILNLGLGFSVYGQFLVH